MYPLILLPGLACDEQLWQHQLAVLAGHHSAAVQVADVHQRADTLPEMAALLLAEHPGPLLLAGCSMGGMVALEAARQAPQRVRGLAVLGSTARADTPAIQHLRRQGIAQFEQGQAEPLLRANALFAFHRPHQDRLAPDYVAMLMRSGAAGLIRQNQAVMARADLRPHLGAIQCPTLVVGGERDTLTPPECAQEIAQGIAGAQLQLLPECGHMLTWEQPEAVNALLLGWLSQITPGP